MENTSYIALSRQTALWRQMETVANNLANVNTPGYRAQDLMFTEHLAKTYNSDTSFRENLNYVQDFGVVTDLAAGTVSQTENPMDLAIEDKGFFVVETPDGPRYTRAGRFVLDDQGQLVNSAGLPVLSTNDTPFFIAPNEGQFTVAKDGTISTENGPIGRIKVVTFDDEQKLKRAAGGLYEPGIDQTPTDAEGPRIAQGALEGSNVNGVLEMTRMIDVQRNYMHSQNLIERENDRIRKAMETFAKPV